MATSNSDSNDTLQTVKEGEITDKGPHGRNWGPQEEFIGDDLKSFPKEYGAGVNSGQVKSVRWPFVLGAILLAGLLASRSSRFRARASGNRLDELI